MQLCWSRAAGVSQVSHWGWGQQMASFPAGALCWWRFWVIKWRAADVSQQPSQHPQWWEGDPWDPETLQVQEPESSSYDDKGWKLVSPGTTWRTALPPFTGLWPQNTFSALEAASINAFCCLCLSTQQLQEEVAGESSWRLPTAVAGGPHLLHWATV